ncbi:MAG: ATP-dependent RNA helicase RhlE [Bacteroidetes bacterium]|nr:MAG: ATP-dependent RNA helicase RhlE [Bacteroidota bacterium]
MTFESLGLSPALLEVLSTIKYSEPYPVQSEVIPAVMNRKDILGIAPTGSGKTAGYVLPLLMNLQEKKLSRNRHVQVLVLVPTRELAIQVNDVFKLFGAAVPGKIKILAVYGGVAVNPQMMALQGVNILIATPGRLLELEASNAVKLSGIETLVLDEADKMLNLGFQEEMNRIFELLPKKRQNLLFSATLSDDVNNINRVLLHDPVVVKIENEKDNIDLIEQTAYLVPDERKGPLLRYLIKQHSMKQVLVFASSVYSSEKVAEKLRNSGVDATAMHSKLSQKARTDAMERFRSGKLRVMVATDLISRGIDIKFLPYVINYELPRSPKDYIHRIGRTGRAESPGEAISFVSPVDEHHFRVIQKKMGKWVTLIDSKNIEFRGF